MRARFAIQAMIFVAFTWAAPVYAHGVDRVRRELLEQGYEQLEFQRTKPPFKVDACRGGERFHLHVDYYGKITEQTSIGSCGGDAAVPPAAAPPPVAAPTDASSDEASSITSDAPAPSQSSARGRSASQADACDAALRQIFSYGWKDSAGAVWSVSSEQAYCDFRSSRNCGAPSSKTAKGIAEAVIAIAGQVEG